MTHIVGVFLFRAVNVNKSSKKGARFPKVMNFNYSLTGKRIIKIGIFELIPWSYIPEGEAVWKGYCIDLIGTLAERMDFDYELIVSQDVYTISHPNGTTYGGVISDLIEGVIDMAVAPVTLTAGRAELADFITPYFENSGISMVLRKPVRSSSVFRFMAVLSFDVWLCLINAIFITAVAVWFMEKLLPKNDRKYNLIESIWFAVTTFASQGPGDIPTKTPHRILAVAYWMFVLVMMTTFTSNLAAFLTVERLKDSVSSLWELRHQSRIKFTVVRNSRAHYYFKNMTFAEETLFKIWTRLALTQSRENESFYRTWDYPIREDYRLTLSQIERNEPVANLSIGLQKILENEQGEFAIIHDTAELRFYIYQDCRLVEIGEIFGERPYSIAIRKQSELRRELDKIILDLHDERYFENLNSKWWNASNLMSCDRDGYESVSLESIGGVFIAALCGTLLALVSLVRELFVKFRSQAYKTPVWTGPAFRCRNKFKIIHSKTAKSLNRKGKDSTIFRRY